VLEDSFSAAAITSAIPGTSGFGVVSTEVNI
jgi:hypothetical protein